jgi:hypothetical protein
MKVTHGSWNEGEIRVLHELVDARKQTPIETNPQGGGCLDLDSIFRKRPQWSVGNEKQGDHPCSALVSQRQFETLAMRRWRSTIAAGV